MRKLLFVSTSFPSGLGGTRRVYNELASFRSRFEVHFIRLKLDSSSDRAALSLPQGVKFRQINCGRAAPDLAALLLVPTCWDREMKIRAAAGEIQRYADEHGIDILVAHTIDCCVGLRGVRVRAKIAEVLDSVLNYYRSKNESQPSIFSLAMQAHQRLCYPLVERLIGASYDLLVFVSSLDLPQGELSKKSLAVEARDPPLAKRNLGKRSYGAVIFGRWDHPPNRDGLAKVAGRLGEINGKVLLIGPHLPQRGWPGNVVPRGFVEDVSPALSDSKVCIIPVWYGAGLQNKLFDALRHGCVVVSTGFTKKTHEANGFSSSGLKYSGDLVRAANEAVSTWSPKDAAFSYKTYAQFQNAASSAQSDYLSAIGKLLSGS